MFQIQIQAHEEEELEGQAAEQEVIRMNPELEELDNGELLAHLDLLHPRNLTHS